MRLYHLALLSLISLILSYSLVFAAPLNSTKENPVILQAFDWYLPDPGSKDEIPESNLWKFIAQKGADQFKNDYFTHIWLPPVSKAFSSDSSYNVGYAVYDRYDLGEFDQMGRIRTKYGLKKELIDAVKVMHKNDLKVIGDIVMNHQLGGGIPSNVDYDYGFKVYPDGSVKSLGAGQIQAWLTFDFANKGDRNPRKTEYSSFVWKPEHFTGIETFGAYYLLRGKQVGKESIFNDLSQLPEKDAEMYKKVRSRIILGAQLDHLQPDVQRELLTWTKWFINEIGLDGFRVDAIRHMDIPFISMWGREIADYMKVIGKDKDMLMFGENWDGWAERLNSYLLGSPSNNVLSYSEGMGPQNYAGINKAMGLFDVPLHYDFQKISHTNNSYPPTRMIDLPSRGLLAKSPKYTVTFVDNHDTIPTQQLESYILANTKIQAYAFILLHQNGIPCVFYRDLYQGNFVSPYQNDQKDYFYKNISALLELRQTHAYGEGQFFMNNNKPGVLGYKRMGDSNHNGSGLIYLIREPNNGDNGLNIPVDSREWKLVLGNGSYKNGTFYLENSNFAVWVPNLTKKK